MDGHICGAKTAAAAGRGWISVGMIIIVKPRRRTVIVTVQSNSCTTTPAPCTTYGACKAAPPRPPRLSLPTAVLKLPMSWDGVGDGVCLAGVAVVGVFLANSLALDSAIFSRLEGLVHSRLESPFLAMESTY